MIIACFEVRDDGHVAEDIADAINARLESLHVAVEDVISIAPAAGSYAITRVYYKKK